MNLEGGGITRCVRHPSQFFTGFCSSCLDERLSTVDSTGKIPGPSCSQQTEIVEVPNSTNATSDARAEPGEVRVRRTLLYLFQLDDGSDSREKECDDGDQDRFRISKPTVGNESPENQCTDRTDVPTSYSAAVDVIVGAHVSKKLDDLPEGENLKGKGASSWLSSVFSKKALRWRMRSASKKKAMHERSQNVDLVPEQMETKVHSRRSCDGSSFHGRSRVSWEAPRHSWDGSMMSKALACSFACLEEREDDCCRAKRGIPHEIMISDTNPSTGTADVNRVTGVALTSEKTISTDGARYEDSQQAVAISSIIRKKSNKWSKVWDRSITSPFKDFSKKCEHVLERSLSESWRDSHKDKSIDSLESVNGYGPSFAVKNQCINRSTNAVNGDPQNPRPDWQRKKSEFKIGRSRSVHYSSPGNLDNGLLRFYLTPLRSSRRITSKGRAKPSHSFARGIFGL